MLNFHNINIFKNVLWLWKFEKNLMNIQYPKAVLM
jgi:hypothetical protein